MITSIDFVGIKYDIDTRTKAYVTKKIGRLDKYLPRHARKSASLEIKLRQVNRDHGNKYEAEVLLNVPDKQITAKDSTVNMMAAIDIVEAKILAQIHRYKQATNQRSDSHHLLRRFKRSPDRVF